MSGLLLCGDATVRHSTLAQVLTEAGFEEPAVVARWADAVEQVAITSVDVVVVDLALVGALGLRVVTVMKAVAPACEVIIVSPLPHIDADALAAGAAAVVHPSDLRPLRVALRRLTVAWSRA